MRDSVAEGASNRGAFCGKGGVKQQVLIEIDGEVEDVLDAEPVIRCFKSGLAKDADITVCSRHEDLFRNHPSVSRIVSARGGVSTRGFDVHYRLGGGSVKMDASRLPIVPKDDCPRVYLDSFDLVRMQRFGLTGSDQPRIVIGAGAGDYAKLWDDDKWLEFCDLLSRELNANIIQVGQRGEMFFGYGSNLIGKLTAREAATVVKSSDLLVSVDNGYGALAEAVGGCGVIVSGAARPTRSEGGIVLAGGLGVTTAKDISIEMVLDGMADASRKAHRRQMELLSCA